MAAAPAAPPRRARPAPARAGGPTAGTGRLVLLALRRDRVRLPVWIAAITATLVSSASAFPGIYPDAAARQARATLMGSPAAVAIGGPGIGADDYTFGAMMTNEMLALTAVFVALMGVLTVVRHTREGEEDGSAELLLAAPVGRRAPLAAALVVAVLADAVLAAAVAAGLGSLRLESVDWPGSALYGAALGSVGLVFAGVAAVAAQVSGHARTASGLAGLAIGAAFSLRAVGDVTGVYALSWLSPFGWAQRTYAFVDDRWWPLGIAVAAAAALAGAAAWLGSRRDFGAGLRQPRPGPSRGSASLGTPPGLVVRLQRTALAAWVLALLGFGLVYGTLLGQVREFAGDLDVVHRVLAGIGGDDLIRSFLSLLVLLLAMTSAVFAVLAVLRARSAESSGTAEAVLATPVSRARWLGAHALVAWAGAAAVLLAGAFGVGLSGAAALGEPARLGQMLAGALVQLAPLALVVGLAAALYGWAPRAAGLAWVPVVYGLFVGTFGGLLGLPGWMADVSPFALVPALPAEDFTAWPVLGLLAAAAALYAAGVAGFRRRDVGR